MSSAEATWPKGLGSDVLRDVSEYQPMAYQTIHKKYNAGFTGLLRVIATLPAAARTRVRDWKRIECLHGARLRGHHPVCKHPRGISTATSRSRPPRDRHRPRRHSALRG